MTDLVTPNPSIMSTGFIQLGIIVVTLLVGLLRRSEASDGLPLWAKLNAPLVSLILSELWAVASYVLFRPVPAIDEYFIVGIWMAGGTSIVSSIFKDFTDGSVTTSSSAGVAEMRAKNSKKGGVGA